MTKAEAVKLLGSWDACDLEKRSKLTLKGMLTAATLGDLEWVLEHIGGDTWAEYEKVTAPAGAKYRKARASALVDYDKAFDSASAEYRKVHVSAEAEYDKARASAARKIITAWMAR